MIINGTSSSSCINGRQGLPLAVMVRLWPTLCQAGAHELHAAGPDREPDGELFRARHMSALGSVPTGIGYMLTGDPTMGRIVEQYSGYSKFASHFVILRKPVRQRRPAVGQRAVQPLRVAGPLQGMPCSRRQRLGSAAMPQMRWNDLMDFTLRVRLHSSQTVELPAPMTEPLGGNSALPWRTCTTRSITAAI